MLYRILTSLFCRHCNFEGGFDALPSLTDKQGDICWRYSNRQNLRSGTGFELIRGKTYIDEQSGAMH